MRLEKLRRQVAETCRSLTKEGLVKGTSGNVSARSEDLVAISPGSVDYELLEPRDICLVDLAGTVVEGDRSPSSELHMHLGLYRATDAGAVVHSHSYFASVLSTLVQELPAIHYMIATLGGPIRVTDYHTFGSQELADDCVTAIEGRHGVILGSHGALTVGPDLPQALKRSVTLEWLCEIYYRATLHGSPRILSDVQLARAREQMRTFAYARKG